MFMQVGCKRKRKRTGEERALFQELLLNYNPLAPSGGQEQNNMSIKEKSLHLSSLKNMSVLK